MKTKICLERRHFGKKHEVDIKPDVANKKSEKLRFWVHPILMRSQKQ